jgi:hypothetical protein
MIIHNLNFVWTCIRLDKADTVLVIDPDAVLSFSIPGEDLQPIARRDSQFIQ